MLVMGCLMASTMFAQNATFTMSNYFDGTNQSKTTTNPVASTISTNASKSNAKDGKLGSDGHYFQIVLSENTFTAASINGFINTTNTSKNWAFQFSTDGGTNWSAEVTQANDGNKSAHDIAVGVTIPNNANGFRVIRRAGTSTVVNSITLTLNSAGPTVSDDATLSALTYNGTSVPNFSAQTEHYDVELPAGTTTVPTVVGTANESHATVSVTPATNLPGTTNIVVTAQDGTTTKTYSITFTVASSKPKVLTATWANIQGTANVDNVNMTITGQVKNGSSLTLTPQFTGNNIASWTPTGAQNFSNGSIFYEFSASSGHMETYEVTITEADPVSSDATLKWLKYGDASVPNFSAQTFVYNIEMKNGQKTPPQLSAEANESHATVQINQPQSIPGSGTVVVTAQDGTTQLTYTVNYTVEVPPTDLTLHVPEVYEAKEIAGGYNTPLTVFNNREYEVFYINRDSESKLDVATLNTDKTGCITTSTGDNSMKAKDGWFTVSAASSGGDQNGVAKDEFGTSIRKVNMQGGSEILLNVQGYDQFSFYGKDNSNSTSKCFEVYINGVKQSTTPDNTYSIRRFTLSPGRNLVRITALSTSSSVFVGFSLRLAQEPRTKHLKGNDSTQVVMQTNAIKPITYVTKYNNIPGGETRLEWIGAEANGITLSKIDGSLTDTLVLSGNANCATGTYNYAVVAYYNNVETNRATGSFTVTSDIQATSDTIVKVYNGEEMDQITFKYYALSANNVQLTWPNGQPNGISGSSPAEGKYIIGGTPQITGTLPQEFPYSITVEGAQTVIQGKITVEKLEYGENAVLYLYKNNLAYEQDAVYNYIKGAKKWNLVTRKQKEDGLRPAEQYANYKWVLISEDVDADNTEVIQVIRGGANLPVLNLKGFTYASNRLNWGHPDNGAVDSTATKNKGCKLFIQQPTHPIFAANLNYLRYGDSIAILSNYERNGIMPIEITGQATQGSLCLATGYTRDIENYYGYGAQQTALHEVPASMRGGHKYICLPLARAVTLNANGTKLIEGIITYLTSPDDSGIEAPLPQINSFSLFGFAATINQGDNTILLSLPQEKYEELEGAEPEIVMADTHTHIETNASSLQYAIYLPKVYVVSDYITRRAYSLTIELYDPQGIDEVYEAGMWVNIYDIYGRKVTTTNEDVYTMDLPQGMYIIVTESGKTLKIMR